MNIKEDLLTFNFTAGGMKEIRGIVLHSMWGTYLGSIAWFKNPTSKASAHYMISKEGEITRMVKDTDMAWHAGIIDDVAPDWVRPNPNWYCLGIELEDMRDANWQYPQAQRDAVSGLVKELMKKYSIDQDHLVYHRQLNPSRRSDPVGNFSYEWLLENETGSTPYDIQTALKLLEEYKDLRGYGNYEATVRALLGDAKELGNCQESNENLNKDNDKLIELNEKLRGILVTQEEALEKAQDDLEKCKQKIDCADWSWLDHLKAAYKKFIERK